MDLYYFSLIRLAIRFLCVYILLTAVRPPHIKCVK